VGLIDRALDSLAPGRRRPLNRTASGESMLVFSSGQEPARTVASRLRENGSTADGLLLPQADINQIDLRLSKAMKFGRTRVQVTASGYNLLNTSAALIINTAYGPTWLQPTNVLQGRLFKFGVQLDY
jgi:hypothetical protein